MNITPNPRATKDEWFWDLGFRIVRGQGLVIGILLLEAIVASFVCETVESDMKDVRSRPTDRMVDSNAGCFAGAP